MSTLELRNISKRVQWLVDITTLECWFGFIIPLHLQTKTRKCTWSAGLTVISSSFRVVLVLADEKPEHTSSNMFWLPLPSCYAGHKHLTAKDQQHFNCAINPLIKPTLCITSHFNELKHDEHAISMAHLAIFTPLSPGRTRDLYGREPATENTSQSNIQRLRC